MIKNEILEEVKRLIALGEDPTYLDIALMLSRSDVVSVKEHADFIDLYSAGKLSQSSLYTKVRKRIATLVKQGKLAIEKDGKRVIVTLPENRVLPEWDVIKAHMVDMYPEWFTKKEGGRNTGGGYSFLFKRFYDEVEDFLN